MPERKASRGPHKVLMEDAAGRRAWGFEVEKVPGIEIGGKMRLGAKVILRSVPIARGLLLLQPSNTTVLGGKVEAWDNAWAQKRKESLKAAVERAKSE
ncbi:hypothetical protein BDZ91DRAFT_684384 [Kalaharituber pfeilii]|nr:hypothetical protein BDZ91DRAFT_684384 [Kalaharituber pfeilii]